MCSYIYPPAPSPNSRTLRFPFALPHAPCATAPDQAIRQLPRGLGAPFSRWAAATRLRICSIILFSANTRTEKPRSTHTQIQSKETERQWLEASHQKRWRQGGRMPPDGKAPKWMEPSVQSLSHAWVECSVGWHSRGCWTG